MKKKSRKKQSKVRDWVPGPDWVLNREVQTGFIKMKSELWLQGDDGRLEPKKKEKRKVKKVLNSAEQTADLYYELNTLSQRKWA